MARFGEWVDLRKILDEDDKKDAVAKAKAIRDKKEVLVRSDAPCTVLTMYFCIMM